MYNNMHCLENPIECMYTHTCTHTLLLHSLICTHTLTLTHTLTHITLTHTHIHSPLQTHTHTLTYTHFHTHTQGYQTQLSSLQRQRRELQQALQSAHPGAAAYQRQRQQFKDSIIGLAASLAGLRSNMTHGAQAGTKAREAIQANTKTLEVHNLHITSQ